MRFKTFLNEGVSTAYKSIPEDTAVELGKQYFTEALASKYPHIVRGMNAKLSGKNYYYISGISGRTSANTSNEYTLLIDNLPAWNNYPKRGKSLICTTIGNLEYAGDFGEPFIILPKNGVKFGVCRGFDFWEGFSAFDKAATAAKYTSFGTTQLSMLNEIIRSIFTKAGVELYKKNRDFSKLKHAFDEGNKFLQDPNSIIDKDDKVFFKTVIKGKETMFDFIANLLDPDRNGFDLVTYDSIEKMSNQKFEIWTEGPVLALGGNKFPEYDELVEFYQDFRTKVLAP